MYNPIQIPYLLNSTFAKAVQYTETPGEGYGGFVICFWEMQPRSAQTQTIETIIVADGCIDLVVAFDERAIGFAGMSQTEFHHQEHLPCRSFGARLSPGAFHQLTGLSAKAAMDCFLPVEAVYEAFNKAAFFSMPYEQAKAYFQNFLRQITQGKTPDCFTTLFDRLYGSTPPTAQALYQMLGIHPRQCQRLFAERYGISPKMVLSILRFQRCVEVLTAPDATSEEAMRATSYYDQPHFIKDFKRNLGVTPQELIRLNQA